MFAARWFPTGLTAEAAAHVPSLVLDHKDRLQEDWIRRVLRRDVRLPAHRLPSMPAFVSAAGAGVGWAMNPQASVRKHLAAGHLVELLPDRPLHVPLYGQMVSLRIPVLDALTRRVLRVALTRLVRQVPHSLKTRQPEASSAFR